MHEKTLELLHQSYASAMFDSCINPVSVEEHMLETLENANIPKEDSAKIDYFLSKLSRSIMARKKTFQSTNICAEVLHVSIYIIAWINTEYNIGLDTNITARRKSLESELAKILESSDNLNPTQIMDLFGIRFNMLNSENGIHLSCFLIDKIVNILCNLSRKDRKSFLSYIQKFDGYTQERIMKLLEIPFILEVISRKDTEKFNPEAHPEVELATDDDRKILEHLKDNIKFYFEPKSNGYQSIHCVLSIDTSSSIMPGFQIELQFRTWKMHVYAENDITASHESHKEDVADYAAVFHLNNEEVSNVTTRAFNSYKDVENDVDGIYYSKVFYNRRMNNISL